MAEAYRDATALSHDLELAAALGNMIVAWANAECHVINVFAYAVNIHHNSATQIFARIPTFESKVKIARAALAEWEAPGEYHQRRPLIDAELDGLSGLAATRNKWVHGLWCWDPKSNETVVFNFRAQEGKGRTNPVTAHDVNDHIRAVLARVLKLAGHLKYPCEPPSSPQKSS